MIKSFLKVLALIVSMLLTIALFAGCYLPTLEDLQGPAGADGKSAYELAVENGYTGTLEEWLAALVGEAGSPGQNGADGKSAYELAVEKGYTGTLDQWLASLIGQTGETGASGTNGTDGKEHQ